MIVTGYGNSGIKQIDTPFPGFRAKLRYFGRVLKCIACQFVKAEIDGRVVRIKAVIAFFLLHERYGNRCGSFNAAAVQIHTFKYLGVFDGVIVGFRLIHFHFDFAIMFFNDDLPSVEIESCILRDAFLCHDCHGSHDKE